LRWLQGVELCLGRVEQILPGCLELRDAFRFQHLKHIDEVDTDRAELVEDLLGGRRRAGDG